MTKWTMKFRMAQNTRSHSTRGDNNPGDTWLPSVIGESGIRTSDHFGGRCLIHLTTVAEKVPPCIIRLQTVFGGRLNVERASAVN